MTPTDKAAIEGLIAFIKSDTRINGDVALTECRKAFPALQRLLAGETREADKPAGVPVSELLDLHNWCREQVEVIARNPCAPAVVGEAYDEAANRLYKLISRHQDPHHG